MGGYFSLVCLAGHGVGLTQHLLGDKFELSAGMVSAAAGLLKGIQVGVQSVNFFADVGAFRKNSDFLHQILFVHLHLSLAEKEIDALGQSLVIIIDHKWGAF